MSQEIDLQSERVIPLQEVPQHLPRRRGKRTHYQTVHRWTTRGAGGHKLASVKIGGVRYTSLEALERFFAARQTPLLIDAHQDAVDAALSQAGL